MHKTLIVKGMMCPHCEAHCRESLEKVDGVVSAKCDHNACTAEVELSREASTDTQMFSCQCDRRDPAETKKPRSGKPGGEMRGKASGASPSCRRIRTLRL